MGFVTEFCCLQTKQAHMQQAFFYQAIGILLISNFDMMITNTFAKGFWLNVWNLTKLYQLMNDGLFLSNHLKTYKQVEFSCSLFSPDVKCFILFSVFKKIASQDKANMHTWQWYYLYNI